MFDKLKAKTSNLSIKGRMSDRFEASLNATKRVVHNQTSPTQLKVKKLIKKRTRGMDVVLTEVWPRAESEILKLFVETAESTLSDTEKINSVITSSYEFLPTAVRIVVSREVYVDYCTKRRYAILAKVVSFKTAKLSSRNVGRGNLVTDREKLARANMEREEIYPNLLRNDKIE